MYEWSYMCVRGVSFVYVMSGHTCVLGVSVLSMLTPLTHMYVRGVSFVKTDRGHTCVTLVVSKLTPLTHMYEGVSQHRQN